MRVVVVGGGIGGLACAQGLRRHGVDVVVVERDRDLAATGGYKLHLGQPALAALRGLLPPDLLEQLYGSAVGTRGFRIALRDHRGRLLLRAGDEGQGLSLDVDRVTLRLVLADGLGERLLTGRRCTGWSVDDEEVRVTLEDGSVLRGDVLVVADGADSRLVRQLCGGPTSTPTGLVGVAGRSRWEDLSQSSQQLLEGEPMLAIGPGGTGLFATAHDPAGSPAVRTARGAVATTTPMAIWGLIAVEGALPARPHDLGSGSLTAAVVDLLRRYSWTETVVRMVEVAIPSSVAAFRLHGADPDRLAPWPASRATALGDAVHAMPPTGGQGAATAILDAGVLVDRLAAADRGELGVVMAVLDYETTMRAHAALAVRESLQPVGWIRATATPIGSRVTRVVLPAAAAAARVGRGVRRRG